MHLAADHNELAKSIVHTLHSFFCTAIKAAVATFGIIQCWNFPEVSCSEIFTMRTSVLLTAGILAIVGLFDLTNSTFTGTGALTLTIPALTTTGTALTATQAAALGLGAVGLLGAAALGVAAGV